MLFTLEQHDPELATVFSRWYTGSTTHRMHHDGSYPHIHASSGIDQGCPALTMRICSGGRACISTHPLRNQKQG